MLLQYVYGWIILAAVFLAILAGLRMFMSWSVSPMSVGDRLQSDRSKMGALSARLQQHEAVSDRPLVVSLDEFFDGNHDYGSIGCNLSDHPGPQAFRVTLQKLREHRDVQDVLIELHGFEDESSSPFSEVVYIITSLPVEAVADQVANLQPDEVGEGFYTTEPEGLPHLRPGFRVVRLWWD